MRPIPIQTIGAVAEACFVCEIGPERVCVAATGGDRVLVQRRNESPVRAPNEIWLGESIEEHANHSVILAVGRTVVEPLDGEMAIHGDRRGEQIDLSERSIGGACQRAGKFSEQLAG